MGFIKIGYDEKGNLLHTVCNGKPDAAEFYYTDDKGTCKGVNDPVTIEFSQENLKRMVEVFNGKVKK